MRPVPESQSRKRVRPSSRFWGGGRVAGEREGGQREFTIGDVQFGYEVTSSAGGLDFGTNHVTASGG
ncbi:hypothetical protein ACIHFC_30190 [Streptomyces sp. NPDC052013]|uniref:hypothetical protein n=1 Tax=Streptomyces sp. NPDC052013 TaxID=3365679 RepID=UPI0037D09BB7